MTWDQFRDLLPVLTFVAGYLGSLLTEFVRERLSQTARRSEARTEFQKENLLALQGAFTDVVSLSQEAMYDRLAATDRRLDADLADRAWRAHMNVHVYAVRVLDDELRRYADDLTTAAYRMTFGRETRGDDVAADEELSKSERIDAMMILHEEAEERLGEVLRKLY